MGRFGTTTYWCVRLFVLIVVDRFAKPMSQLIIVTANQLKAYYARFEKMLAQDQIEQARLREIEERRKAEWDRMRETRPASPANQEGQDT